MLACRCLPVALSQTGFVLGAAISGGALAKHPRFGVVWPGVLEALNLIGSTQVQGRASLGGNLCNGSPAADSVPAMIAAATICTIAGPNGQREAPVEDIVTGPGQTSLAIDEFIVNFFLPLRPPHSGDAYLRFIPRTEMDIAVVGVGVNLVLDADGTCSFARVAIGAVAPTALLVPAASEALVTPHAAPPPANRLGSGVPSPRTSIPMARRNRQSSATCGSHAACRISVTPLAVAAAKIAVSVPVTEASSR